MTTSMIQYSPNLSKTKKKKTNLSDIEKSKLWEIFDNERTEIKNENNSLNNVECLYQNKESGLCGLCNSVLIIMDDGFPTCPNNTCSVIYKNTLDYSPEWRFYGADDKNYKRPYSMR